MAKTPKEPKPLAPKEVAFASGQELGRVGLRGAIPYSGFLWEEALPELRGTKGAEAFRRMADNDPVSSSILYAIESLLRGVKWTVEPNAGAPKEAAAHAAEFVRSVLFEDMEDSFGDTISEILTMLTYGYAIHEIVLKVRKGPQGEPGQSSRYADGYIGLAALAPRSQETVYRWQYDVNGRLLGVEQMLPEGGLKVIPITRCLHFTTSSRRRNPEGRSLLRGAYVTWTRRNTIEQAMGRIAVRAGGIVELRVPGELLRADADVSTVAQRASFQAIADRAAQDRQGAVMIPSDRDESGGEMYSLSYTIPDPRRPVELQGLLDMYNRLIAMTVLGDFLFLGSTTVGSRALADPKIEMFTRAMEAVLSTIAEELNRDLLPRLWAWNGFDLDVLPSLQPGSVASRDLMQFAQLATAMVGAGMQLFPDPATENMVRDWLGLPPLSEEAGGEVSRRPGLDAQGDEGVEEEEPNEPRRSAARPDLAAAIAAMRGSGNGAQSEP